MKPVGDIAFPKMEEDILHFWKDKNIFQTQMDLRKNAEEYAFYDGPPFANGLPHYGHLLATTIKDTVLRYWSMRGFKVARRFGWDCHGLPVEFEIEKREKLKGRPDILKMGVAKFNETCRESVFVYAKEWEKTITRLGRWVDWNDQIRTMDKNYMESVWWVFSELNKKGLIYKDFKVVPYSPRTSSVVSNFEANQNYKNISDPSVFIKFKLKTKKEFILVWTTTPWTLPSNLALAVGKDISYSRIKDKESGETWILATETLGNLYNKNEDHSYETLSEIKGGDLVGLAYEPLFNYFKDHVNAFKILHADYVSTSDGTGVVHQAPAFGEDDFYVCRQHKIQLVDPIDDSGHFTNLVPELTGMYFKDADKIVCKLLKEKGLLVKQGTLVHTYPFDERTDTPLMYRAVPSWYVAVEKIAARLQATNQEINWVPAHIKDGRMGSWLANARDWAISRNRFWGTPLPVWTCDQDPKHHTMISSVAELEAKVSKKVEDIHLHFVSELHFPCTECKGTMKNEGLVFDCWFESGSMPYAQMHYPFENKEKFETVFPADFIAEGLDQTRGWFYTLHVLSTALFDKPSFKNVIVNGIILDETGKKMSKRHRNYTAPQDLIDIYGADSIRLYMLNSPLLRAEDLSFVDQGVKDVTRLVLLPLWNAMSFLTTYASADSWEPNLHLTRGDVTYLKTLSLDEMDRWILSRLETVLRSVEKYLSEYKLYLLVPDLLTFIDELTNWYIRLNRRRFWGEDKSDKNASASQEAAFSTLYFVLLQFSKIFAPFAPFLSEKMYRELSHGIEGVLESVHLCDIPKFNEEYIDKDLERSMDVLRNIVENGRALRQKHKVKIRQVLPALMVVSRNNDDRKIVEHGTQLLMAELNVKKIEFTTEESKHVRLTLKPNLRTLGVRLGAKLRDFTKNLTDLSQSQDKVDTLVDTLEREGKVDLFGIPLTIEDFLIDRQAKDESLIATQKNITILLDTKLTPALLAEGRARELVNRIQNLRKDSGLHVSDRINLEIIAPRDYVKEIEAHADYILGETLGKHLEIMANGGEATLRFVGNYQIDSMTCIIALEVTKN
jgi:isoleucyl-tRNA synthetase